MTNPSIEMIVGLKPAVIVLSMEGNVREDFNKLVDTGVPVFVTNPRTLEGIHKSIRDLGQLTGHVVAADSLVRSMQERENSVKSLVKLRRRTLLLVSLQPLIVAGNGTFVSELLNLTGGVNVAAATLSTYPTLSREAVVEGNPEVIIVMSDVVKDTGDLLRFFPEWTTLQAFRSHRVFSIDSDIVSRPGPRAVEGLVALYRIIQEGRK
jgi:iron complex transport system substrate-binding protein